MRKLIALLFLFLLIFFSGCVEQGGVGTGVVSRLKRIPPDSSIDPETPLLLHLELKNTGEMDARNVEARIIGLDDWSISPNRVQRIEMIEKADPSRKIKGGIDFVEWELRAPKKTLSQPYDIVVEISYDYSTSFEGRIGVVSMQYYIATREKGGIKFQGYTQGPIQIKATSPTTIVSRGKVPVVIEFRNVGKGYVKENLLKITTSGINCGKNEVRLVDGYAQLFCKLEVGSVDVYSEYSFSVKADYTYILSEKSTVTVLPHILR